VIEAIFERIACFLEKVLDFFEEMDRQEQEMFEGMTSEEKALYYYELLRLQQ